MTPFYLDPYILAEDLKDPKRWNLESWPLEQAYATDLAVACQDSYRRVCNTLPRSEGDVLNVAQRIHSLYARTFYARKLVEAAKETGGEVKGHPSAVFATTLARGERLPTPDNLKPRVSTWGPLKRWGKKATLLARSLIFHLQRRSRLGSYTTTFDLPVIAPKNMTVLDREFVGRVRNFIQFFEDEQFLPHRIEETPESKALGQRAAFNLHEDMARVAQELQVPWTQEDQDYLLEITSKYFSECSILLEGVKKKLGGRKMVVFLPGMGPTFYRAIAIAVRQAGGKAFSSEHQWQYNHFYRFYVPLLDFSAVDYHITYCKGSIRNFQAVAKDHPPLFGQETRFFTDNSDRFQKIWEKRGGEIFTGPSKKVLLMDLGFTFDRSSRGRPHEMVYLDSLLKVGRKLKALGLDVILKAHPYGPAYEPLYRFLSKEFTIEKTPLQDLDFTSFDTLVYFTTCTSSFQFGACSSKKVIVLDTPLEKFFDEERAALEKRIHFVPWRENAHNTMDVDEEALERALAGDEKLDSLDYYENFLAPKDPHEIQKDLVFH